MSKLLNYTTNDILDLFPRLADLGCGAFGEEPIPLAIRYVKLYRMNHKRGFCHSNGKQLAN